MPSPGKITADDFTAALDLEQSDFLQDLDEADFHTIGRAAGKELLSRFKTDPGSLPGTFVIKLFLDYQKALAAGAHEPENEEVHISVLELVRESSLPDERKKELLLVERERLEDDLEQVNIELEEL